MDKKFYDNKDRNSKTVELQQYSPLGNVGSVYEAMQLDKIGGKQSTAPLYVRQEARDLWDMLEENDTKRLYVLGSPGTGKSSLLWAWACRQANRNKNVLWMGRSAYSNGFVNYLHPGRGPSLTSVKPKRDISKEIEDLVHNFKGDIIVFDGLTSEIQKQAFSCMMDWSSDTRKVVWAGSHGAPIVASKSPYSIKDYMMYSWKTDDYESAICQSKFRDLINKAGVIQIPPQKADYMHWLEEKIALGGWCARYVFGMTRNEVQKELDIALKQEHNLVTLIKGLQGGQCSLAINRLRSLFKSNSGCGGDREVIVSRYVAHNLVLKTSKEIIAAMTAYSRAANNPAFDGWIFEFDFLNSVKNAVTTEKAFVLNNHVSFQYTNAAQKTHEQGKTSWDITSTKTFANVKDICAWDPTSFKDKSLFLIPEKWNQSGFDGVFVSRPK